MGVFRRIPIVFILNYLFSNWWNNIRYGNQLHTFVFTWFRVGFLYVLQTMLPLQTWRRNLTNSSKEFPQLLFRNKFIYKGFLIKYASAFDEKTRKMSTHGVCVCVCVCVWSMGGCPCMVFVCLFDIWVETNLYIIVVWFNVYFICIFLTRSTTHSNKIFRVLIMQR